MSTFVFKANINCIECVDLVKPRLDKLEQDKSIVLWHLDLNNPEYLLEIEADQLRTVQVSHIIRETGFDAKFTRQFQS
ncbi:MAG TPA: hypothetical protein VGE66_01740 [Chitinophagaceae bacterium]